MSNTLIIILATVAYAAIHSLLASLEAKAWARQRFGPAADRWYRLFYNLFAIITGLPILALLSIFPGQLLYQIPFPWILISTLGQLASMIIFVFGVLQTDLWHFMGLRQIMTGTDDEHPIMITNGLYNWVRHPLYTCVLLLIWLMPVMTVNMLTIFILFTIYLIVGARLEEKRLVHEFGDQYRTYQERVPMLLPLPRWNKDTK
jgi:protein-S-isoprenylcysteine O-methyltransferase Ste14